MEGGLAGADGAFGGDFDRAIFAFEDVGVSADDAGLGGVVRRGRAAETVLACQFPMFSGSTSVEPPWLMTVTAPVI